MVYDVDYREAPMTDIDTAYALTQQGADTPGAFVVPSTARRITEIRIALGSLCQDVTVGTTSAVHLSGSGIKLGEGYFVGPMMAMAGAAATSGHILQTTPMKYKTNIPVVPGGTFNAEAFIHGEDPVSAHVFLLLEYDGVPGRIIDSDYREETCGGTANALTRLGVRAAGSAEADMKPPSTIGEVIFGFIVDPDGHATASYTIGPALHLTGPGLAIAGNYKFLGACGGIGPDVDIAGGDLLINPTRYITNIAIKRGSDIRASAQNIESTSEGHAICGFCYV